MTTSATTVENRHWSSVVLGKIRSLWSTGSANSGLNQLISGRTRVSTFAFIA